MAIKLLVGTRKKAEEKLLLVSRSTIVRKGKTKLAIHSTFHTN